MRPKDIKERHRRYQRDTDGIRKKRRGHQRDTQKTQEGDRKEKDPKDIRERHIRNQRETQTNIREIHKNIKDIFF